jgi:hypothetical protein
MTLPIWLTTAGLLLNLIGTVLLIFSLPASFRGFNSKIECLVFEAPSEGQSDFKFAKDLFRERVLKEKNQSILLSLFFLISGAVLQILSLFLIIK